MTRAPEVTKEEDGLHRDILVAFGAAAVKAEPCLHTPSSVACWKKKWMWARMAVEMNFSTSQPLVGIFRRLCFYSSYAKI